jgi:6-phosphogluconolactonase/glucosamine-6-phosphate isomerase/deaminase
MKFILTDRETAEEQIADRINQELERNNVLLLLSGGSNVSLGVEVVKKLNRKLTVGLIDERYGPVGHKDSNWQKLLEAGLEAENVELLPVLESDFSLSETAAAYASKLQEVSAEKTVIGIFGIGADGHTAGILPHSEAVDSTDLFTNYVGPDFQRLTITPTYIKQVDVAFLVAYGDNKRAKLEELKANIPVGGQPAQVLKDVRELIVYNNQLG